MADLSSQKIRIRMKGYDFKLLDQSAGEIVDTAMRTGARVAGPIPLPTSINKYTERPGVAVKHRILERRLPVGNLAAIRVSSERQQIPTHFRLPLAHRNLKCLRMIHERWCLLRQQFVDVSPSNRRSSFSTAIAKTQAMCRSRSASR